MTVENVIAISVIIGALSTSCTLLEKARGSNPHFNGPEEYRLALAVVLDEIEQKLGIPFKGKGWSVKLLNGWINDKGQYIFHSDIHGKDVRGYADYGSGIGYIVMGDDPRGVDRECLRHEASHVVLFSNGIGQETHHDTMKKSDVY